MDPKNSYFVTETFVVTLSIYIHSLSSWILPKIFISEVQTQAGAHAPYGSRSPCSAQAHAWVHGKA